MSDNITLPREVVQFALQVLEKGVTFKPGWVPECEGAIEALRIYLAAPRPEQKFDHSIGADRFKVVRGTFWWHIKIGDSPTEHGKFRSSAAAQEMADDLLREFRNGAFVQNALAAPSLEVTVDPRLTPDEAAAISSALAAPRPEPVAWHYWNNGGASVMHWGPSAKLDADMQAAKDYPKVHKVTPLYTAPPAAAPQPEPTHPGYIIGSHWLETAYSRICAGEAEANVLRDYGLVREEAFLTGVAHLKAENEALRRDAERYRYLRNRDPNEVFGKSGRAAGVWIDWEDDMAGLQLLTGDDADAAIDAAMGDKT